MQGTSELIVHGDYDVLMSGTSELINVVEPEVEMIGTSEMYATADVLSGGEAVLPFLIAHGYETAPDGTGKTTLPSIFQNSGEGGFYVPTPITIGFATLPLIGGSGVSKTVKSGGGTAVLPSLTGIGGDFRYGVGSAELPFLKTFAMYGLPNDEADMIDYMITGGSMSSNHILTVVFISEGVVTDTVSLTRVQAVEFISQLEQSDIMTVLGTFDASFIESITAIDRSSQNVISTDGNVGPDVDTEGMVWVVNTETNASSQYEQYGFNSFFNRPFDGKPYSICPSGIYRLDGDTDAGAEISALIDFGRSDYGTSHKKKIPYIYIGVGSNGVLYLKVDCDGRSNTYEMRGNSTAIKNHRVKVGKGKHGNYWNPVLMNKDGADFDLNAVQFEPIVSSRKI